MRDLVVLLSLAASVVACGDDGALGDGGADAARTDAGADGGPALPPPPTPPAAPTLPELGPCAEGFHEATVGDVVELTICDPAPHEACPAGQHLFVAGCRVVGPPCPSGPFADAAGVPSPLYVDPSAAPGGDGTEASPLSSLADAVAAAPDGATLLLAAGDHEGGVALDRELTLRGACPSATRVVAPSDGSAGTNLTVSGGDVRVEGLTVTGDAIGVRVTGGSLAMAGIVVDAAATAGVTAEGGTLTIDDLAVTGTRASSAGLGVGLVSTGGEIDARRVSLSGNHTFSTGTLGGVVVMEGARISDSLPVGSDDLGLAISVAGAGSVTCTACVLERATGVAAHATQPGSTLTLVDSRVDDTRGALSDDAAVSVLASEQGTMTLTRTAITRGVAGIGLGNGGTAEVTDVVVHEPGIDAGFVGFARTELSATRLAISGAGGIGFQLTDPMARATVTDLVVASTRPRSTGIGGRGLEANDGASVSLTRAWLVDNFEVALFVDNGASLEAEDLAVDDTVAKVGVGRGINVQGGGLFEAERLRVTRSHEVGIFVFDVGSAVTLRAASITDTRARDCPADECLAGAGMGIVALDGASLRVTDFLVSGNALAGLQVASASAEWTDGVVRDHPIGVNLQMPTLDPSALTEGVIYVDNDQNLDTTELPTPAPAAPSAGR